jgi:O-antigen/teichoic acid export membrane protein
MVAFVRILSWAVIIFAISSVVVEIIGASGRHGVRAAILGISSVIGAAVSAVATWYAPPTGTFVAYYVVEAATAVAAWLVLIRLMRDKSPSRHGNVAPEEAAIEAASERLLENTP